MLSSAVKYVLSTIKDIFIYILFTVSIFNTFSDFTVTVPVIILSFVVMVLSMTIGVTLRDEEMLRIVFRSSEEEPISSWKKALISSAFLIPIAVFISTNPMSRFWPVISISIMVYLGYSAEERRRNGQQPYQKYSWVPTGPVEFVKFPYTAGKLLWKRLTGNK